MQQQGNGYDCGLYCYTFSKRALQRHEDLKACNGQNDDLTDKIHGILVEGYEDSIQPLLLRQEMYGHMQEACRLDEMEASMASIDVQTKRLWRYVPNVLNVIPSVLSKGKEESFTREVQPTMATLLRGTTGNGTTAVEKMDLIETEEVQQVVGQANEQTIAFAEANLIKAFQGYISYSIKAKNSLATLVKMLLEDAQYYNHLRDKGLTLTDFLNGFGKVCLLLMMLISYIMFMMVCYVMFLALLRYRKTMDYIRFHPDFLAKNNMDLESLKPLAVKQLVIQALAGLEDEESMQFAFKDIVFESSFSYFVYSRKNEYKVVPNVVKKAVQAIGHEIAVEFAQQLLLGLMEYIDLDKNGKPKNLDSLKGTQLFIKYPFGGKQYEYRCHFLKELAIGLVQGRPVDNKYSSEIW